MLRRGPAAVLHKPSGKGQFSKVSEDFSKMRRRVTFGVFWMGMASSIGAPSFFLLFGLLFIGGAIFSMIHGTAKAGAYQSQLSDYETRRQSLVARLEQARRD